MAITHNKDKRSGLTYAYETTYDHNTINYNDDFQFPFFI